MRSLLLALLLISGCAEIPQAINSSEFGVNKKIASVSILGNTFKCSSIGFTVFNNESSDSNIDSFNVDELIQSTSNSAFSDLVSANPVNIEYTKEMLDKIYTPNALAHPSDSKLIQSYVNGLMQKNELDYLVLFIRLDSPEFVFNTNQRLDTLGCVTRGNNKSLRYFLSTHMYIFHRDSNAPVAQRFIRRNRTSKEHVLNANDMASNKLKEFISDAIKYEIGILYGHEKWVKISDPI